MSHSARRVFLVGLALAVAGSVLFSAKAVVVKLAYRHGVDPATFLALRLLMACPFFAVVYAWAARGKPALALSDHLRLFGLGLLGYYAASYLDFLGLQYASAGLARLILYLTPTIVLLLSVAVLGKRLVAADIAALALCYGGIVLVFWHDVSFAGGDVPLGAALVFGSAVCYSVYLVVCGEMVRRIGALRLTSHAMLGATFGVVAQFLVVNPPELLVQQPAAVYGLSAVNAIVCTVLPVFATMMSVERIGAGNASLASMMGPVSTILLAWVYLDETVSGWQLAGTVLVLGGVYVLSRKKPDADARKGAEAARSEPAIHATDKTTKEVTP